MNIPKVAIIGNSGKQSMYNLYYERLAEMGHIELVYLKSKDMKQEVVESDYVFIDEFDTIPISAISERIEPERIPNPEIISTKITNEPFYKRYFK